jgi:DNA-binding MarR family transcriptional regulator
MRLSIGIVHRPAFDTAALRPFDNSIVIRYNFNMPAQSKTSVRYRVLADFRYEIRKFLTFSEKAARRVGLEPQQHQALLAIKGLPPHNVATIRVLAERLQIVHHSAVELVNRLETKKLIRRSRSTPDRRAVVLNITPSGSRLLRNVTLPHVAELKKEGEKLLQALNSVLNDKEATYSRKDKSRGEALATQRKGRARE